MCRTLLLNSMRDHSSSCASKESFPSSLEGVCWLGCMCGLRSAYSVCVCVACASIQHSAMHPHCARTLIPPTHHTQSTLIPPTHHTQRGAVFTTIAAAVCVCVCTTPTHHTQRGGAVFTTIAAVCVCVCVCVCDQHSVCIPPTHPPTLPPTTPREVLCSPLLLATPEKVDWRQCSLGKNEETDMAAKMRANFQPFDFTEDL